MKLPTARVAYFVIKETENHTKLGIPYKMIYIIRKAKKKQFILILQRFEIVQNKGPYKKNSPLPL